MAHCLIEKGRRKAAFKKYEAALCYMQEGIDVLIELKDKNHEYVEDIYKQMGEYNRQLGNLEG